MESERIGSARPTDDAERDRGVRSFRLELLPIETGEVTAQRLHEWLDEERGDFSDLAQGAAYRAEDEDDRWAAWLLAQDLETMARAAHAAAEGVRPVYLTRDDHELWTLAELARLVRLVAIDDRDELGTGCPRAVHRIAEFLSEQFERLRHEAVEEGLE
jgi:hypothetical protein